MGRTGTLLRKEIQKDRSSYLYMVFLKVGMFGVICYLRLTRDID